MVKIKEKVLGEQKYYYLVHNIRRGKTYLSKEKYLGKEVPANIEQIKKQFLDEIYSQEWFGKFNLIKKEYSLHKKSLPASALEKEQEQFAIKFTYNTNRIEGSTLTLKDTFKLLEQGITPANRPSRDIKETEAHQLLFNEMLNYKKDLSLPVILAWHRQLLKDTREDIAGKVRKHQVAISGSKFLPPSPVEVDIELNEFFSWYNRSKDKEHPVKLAALVHLKLVTIHPFTDGNGRISRLMMNFVLKRHNYPLLDIPYTRRSGYYTSLERSQIKKEERIFLQWFFRRYMEENKRYLKK